jgi:hypothetical protein
MEKRAFVLVLALTLPLLLYGIPFAYAVTAQSTYVVRSVNIVIAASDIQGVSVQCTSPSDYTLHYIHLQDELISVHSADPLNSGGFGVNTGETPNGWSVALHNTQAFQVLDVVTIFCQSPITAVAGVSVPEFGSLYVAIALGAVIYFVLARQHAGKRSAGITTA